MLLMPASEEASKIHLLYLILQINHQKDVLKIRIIR